MYKNFRKLFCVLLVCFITAGAAAQTGGTSELVSIESKAKQISQNDEKVAVHNRNHLQTYSLEQDKLVKMKRELSALIAEKAAVLDEYKRGQFCTGCNTPRSQFKPGESFPHPGQSVRAATAEELASKAKEYDNKISAKDSEIKKFEGEENEFTRKRADLSKQMDALKANSDKLREEIVALSKRYRDNVVAQGKATQKIWISDLMLIVANKHVMEDKVDILGVKLADVDTEETAAVTASNQKVKQQNDLEIQNINNSVKQQETRLGDAVADFQTNAQTLKQELTKLNASLQIKDKALLNKSNTDEANEKLKAERDEIVAALEQTNGRLKTLEDTFLTLERGIKEDIKQKKDKSWDLTVNLPKRQEEALLAVRKAFAVKRKALRDAIDARKEQLKGIGDRLMAKREEYRKKFLEFASLVDAERIRLINACRLAGASCYGSDAHGAIIGNWNTASGCVGQMENNRSIGVYYGCEEESAIYKTHYSAHLNGMSDEDLNALKRTSSKTKYDLILKKVID